MARSAVPIPELPMGEPEAGLQLRPHPCCPVLPPSCPSPENMPPHKPCVSTTPSQVLLLRTQPKLTHSDSTITNMALLSPFYLVICLFVLAEVPHIISPMSFIMHLQKNGGSLVLTSLPDFPPKGEGPVGERALHVSSAKGQGPEANRAGTRAAALAPAQPWTMAQLWWPASHGHPRSHLFCVDQELWDSVPASSWGSCQGLSFYP